jgi:2-dehydropantoate 2-reductase
MSLGENSKVLIFGAGAIGASVAAWLAPHHKNLFVHDQPAVRDVLRKKGITHYQGGHPGQRETVPVNVIDRLDEIQPDVIAIGVKNYSLEKVAAMLHEAYGDAPLILALQNGVENQQVLPRFFPRVVYCVISYNAWLDDPGVVGWQKRGPLIIGTRHNELRPEARELAALFTPGVETVVTSKFQDAAHCKLVINLTNSLTTLIGHGYREITDRKLFQKLVTNLTWEGVTILKAAGHRESKLGGMPPWAFMWAGSHLPRWLTKPLFEKNIKKMVISSMAQDIMQRRTGDSELATINGYLLGLADEHGLAVPFNRAVYEMCVREFAKPDFTPLSVEEVWAEIEPRLK